MYRDAANYKYPGSVVFEGTIDEHLQGRIQLACHAGEQFVASQVRIPLLFPFLRPDCSVDSRFDHGWHEFLEFRATEAGVTDDRERTALEFGAEFCAASREGWHVREPHEIIRLELVN
jgi:hypothetical protein